MDQEEVVGEGFEDEFGSQEKDCFVLCKVNIKVIKDLLSLIDMYLIDGCGNNSTLQFSALIMA